VAWGGRSEEAEVEERRVLAVGLSGYSWDNVLLVEQSEDEWRVVPIQRELCQALELGRVC